MSRIKISQLTELTTPDSNTQNTFMIVTDISSGSPVSKKMSFQVLDTLIDVTQGQANSAFIQANAAFVHANSGFIRTNASFSHANSGFIQANASYTSVNAAYSHANAAFVQANNATNLGNQGIDDAAAALLQATSAYGRANVANAYTAANLSTSLWATSPPDTVQAAVERLANVVIVLNGYTPIP